MFMMQTAKVGRPGKNQRICHSCRKPCLPKNGDWFFAGKAGDTQVFLCKDCERQSASQYQRTIPAR
jgi:hypothetical protein